MSNTLDRFKQDTRFAIRQLTRARSFAAAAILILAVGIGATAAVFSVVEAVVLNPLPFADPARVVNLHPMRDGTPVTTSSNLEFASWRVLTNAFDAVVATVPQSPFTLTRGDHPEVVTGWRATSALTRVLGVSPELGRGFSSTDDQVGAPHVVILSHALWVRDYNAQRAVLGTSIRLDGESYVVIGVMPPSIDAVTGGAQLWVPLTLSATDLLDFKSRSLQIVARLRPGVSLTQGSAAVDASERMLAAQYPMWGKGYTGAATLFASDLVGNLRARLFILLGAVSLVFLIACVNVTNLLLARGNARAREMAIRTALGAERARLVWQLLTESAALSAVAGVGGVALAYGLVRGLVAASPPGVPRIEEASINGPVLLFTLLSSIVCCVVVGLLPALGAANPALQATLREGGRGAGESKRRERSRNVLVAAEVALAMALLCGAGLLIRSAWAIAHVDPGFESGRVFTAQVLLPSTRYPDLASGARVYRTIVDGVSRTPGVRSAALTSSVPLAGSIRAGVGAEGQPMTDGARLIADAHAVSPNYLSTMKIRMQAGRDFAATDNADAPNVAIINAALAKRLWPGQDPIGKRLEGMDPSHQHFMIVIGTIDGVRDVSLDQPPTPEFYVPVEQTPPPLWAGVQGSLIIVARTATEPSAMERPIRGAVDAIDPSLPIANVATMDQLVQGSRATAQFNTLLLTVLGAIALTLASVGVYGVIAYSVNQRTREIGLRMALGASPTRIAGLVARRGLPPIALGAVVGGALSIAGTRVLREQLYGVAPGDPSTIVAIGLLLIAISCLAAWIPTRRAMSISPVTALAE